MAFLTMASACSFVPAAQTVVDKNNNSEANEISIVIFLMILSTPSYFMVIHRF
jgi:hypothetical protein